MSDEQAASVAPLLGAWSLTGATLSPITVGHINETWHVERDGESFVLQRLSRIFAPEVNLDIEVVTRHVAAHGLITPLLVRCADGEAWHRDAKGQTWRLLTYVPGRCFERASSCAMVQSAGVLLGRFHRALSDLRHTFRAPRQGVHDTALHLERLRTVLRTHAHHVAFAQIAPLAHDILAAAEKLELGAAQAPLRVVHGDPKLSNIIFADESCALALVDLDTLSHMALTDELGDALRSWCNRSGEVPEGSRFDVELLDAALAGYATGAHGFLVAQEREQLAAAPLKIALELASRFARDALEESYFGWDRTKYEASWAHQLDRARSQWAVAQSCAAQGAVIAQSVARHFG